MRSHSATILTLATIPLIVLLTYWKASSAYFLEDDFQWLVSAWHFRFSNLVDFSRYGHFYRPVIEIYFYLCVKAFGQSPALFHWASILLHAVNGLVVYGLTRSISRDSRLAFFAAMSFVLLPGYVDAVAWVGAIAEPLSTLFFCLTLWSFLQYLNSRRYVWQLTAMGTFALALLAHESAATVIVMMALADWAASARHPFHDGELQRASPEPLRRRAGQLKTALVFRRGSLERIAVYAPYLALLAGYLMIDVGVSNRNYVVQQGYYRLGPHALRNILDYIVSLYVGKKVLMSYLGIGTALVVFLAKGSRRVRFATLWMLVTLLPFAFFTWGNTSRYLYLPAIGFSMLLGEGMLVLDRLAARTLPPHWRTAVVSAIFAAIVIRFAVFTTRGVDDFVRRTEPYRQYIDGFRAAHPRLPPGVVLRVPAPADARLQHMYLEPLVQWEYADPSIRLQIGPGS